MDDASRNVSQASSHFEEFSCRVFEEMCLRFVQLRLKTVLNPIPCPFLVDDVLYKRSILCRLDVDFLRVLFTSLAFALPLDFVAREIRSTSGKSSLDEVFQDSLLRLSVE